MRSGRAYSAGTTDLKRKTAVGSSKKGNKGKQAVESESEQDNLGSGGDEEEDDEPKRITTTTRNRQKAAEAPPRSSRQASKSKAVVDNEAFVIEGEKDEIIARRRTPRNGKATSADLSPTRSGRIASTTASKNTTAGAGTEETFPNEEVVTAPTKGTSKPVEQPSRSRSRSNSVSKEASTWGRRKKIVAEEDAEDGIPEQSEKGEGENQEVFVDQEQNDRRNGPRLSRGKPMVVISSKPRSSKGRPRIGAGVDLGASAAEKQGEKSGVTVPEDDLFFGIEDVPDSPVTEAFEAPVDIALVIENPIDTTSINDSSTKVSSPSSGLATPSKAPSVAPKRIIALSWNPPQSGPMPSSTVGRATRSKQLGPIPVPSPSAFRPFLPGSSQTDKSLPISQVDPIVDWSPSTGKSATQERRRQSNYKEGVTGAEEEDDESGGEDIVPHNVRFVEEIIDGEVWVTATQSPDDVPSNEADDAGADDNLGELDTGVGVGGDMEASQLSPADQMDDDDLEALNSVSLLETTMDIRLICSLEHPQPDLLQPSCLNQRRSAFSRREMTLTLPRKKPNSNTILPEKKP